MARRIDELDYYRLLGITPAATPDEIQRAFHDFARKYHPDAHREDAALYARYVSVYRRGTEAYRVLRSPAARGAYDAGLREGRLRFQGSVTRSTPPPPLATAAKRKKRRRRVPRPPAEAP